MQALRVDQGNLQQQLRRRDQECGELQAVITNMQVRLPAAPSCMPAA